MKCFDSIRVLPLAAVLAMAAPVCAQANSQSNSQTSSQKNDAPPCKTNDAQTQQTPCADPANQEPGKEPSAAQKFPFPGQSAPEAPKQQSAPDAPGQGSKPPSTTDKFPFPGSAPPMPGSEPDSGSSSSGSSSGGSSSSSSSGSDDPNATPADKPADAADTPRPSGRRRLPKVEKVQSDEERAEEDLKISKYYEQAGNMNAAYLRAKDAVKSLPDEAEMHFALAHMAEKLNKHDEAVAEYNAYLKLAPDGLKIKEAHKALAQLEH